MSGPIWDLCWAKNSVFLFWHDQPQKEHAATRRNTPFMGHVGAMLGLRWVYVGTCRLAVPPIFALTL